MMQIQITSPGIFVPQFPLLRNSQQALSQNRDIDSSFSECNAWHADIVNLLPSLRLSF